MENKEIANQFKLLGDLSLLLGENEFKAKSYQSAYQVIRQAASPLFDLELDDLIAIKGIGKNTAAKILELRDAGQMEALESRKEKVPDGILEVLRIKGLGAKKIRKLWKELNIESLEELKYACNENRLLLLKGFGEKSQADILSKVNYQLQSRNLKRYHEAEKLFEVIQENFNREKELELFLLGEARRKENIVQVLNIALICDEKAKQNFVNSLINSEEIELIAIGELEFIHENQFKVIFHYSEEDNFSFRTEFSIAENKKEAWKPIVDKSKSEIELFESLGYQEIYPELYDQYPDDIISNEPSKLISTNDIKGLVHCHTRYSDGRHTLEEMAEASMDLGLEYMVVTDHSKSAFYANGLDETRVYEQQDEIDRLNTKWDNFKIYKGIESDILPNGSLDYEDDVLNSFDVVIASVHSILNMDEKKATDRMMAAIHNPYTTMLGHPTGRLLLGRKGYPLDHEKIIHACAEQGVDIELNANPFRLDIDWKWIPLCIELGVNIFINPDAHDVQGIELIKYGIYSARKGLLRKEHCPNTFSQKKFEDYIREKKQRRLQLVNNI